MIGVLIGNDFGSVIQFMWCGLVRMGLVAFIRFGKAVRCGALNLSLPS